ncbi:transposase [Lentzea alba]|uniref:transposase n=1 Tax=Lentzea alba TaxID=2714351 RepID=UPI001F5F5AEB
MDRTLIWDQAHLRQGLREYERHYNEHRTHQSLAGATPRVPPCVLTCMDVVFGTHRVLGGLISEYEPAAA